MTGLRSSLHISPALGYSMNFIVLYFKFCCLLVLVRISAQNFQIIIIIIMCVYMSV